MLYLLKKHKRKNGYIECVDLTGCYTRGPDNERGVARLLISALYNSMGMVFENGDPYLEL